MKPFKEAREYYKKLKQEEKEKQKLLNQKTDFSLLETLIKQCNKNPDLKIEVFLKDGTRLLLRCYEEVKSPTIDFNGDYLEIK